MQESTISLENVEQKVIYGLSEQFQGSSPQGERISFTNYYMERNGKPFYGISGEFHFSRCEEAYWEDEIIKIKMNGVNIISTYVFWIHHEEERGIFRFDGRRNLRRFLELCGKHGMYVIVRIGPFNHGEARNGGFPDWLYGMDCEPRSLDPVYLSLVGRLFEEVGAQMKGLYYKDGGPVAGVQIDNEYEHSAAPWEMTTGISNEWIGAGSDGEAYMLAVKKLAQAAGIEVPFYTCTSWGGAVTPVEEMLPLWGGYAFWPWIFYSHKGEHPVTPEYLYRDFHNNRIPKTYNFEPDYEPESRPYACCEMGGGMMCSYHYRFAFPYESVDAMANVKLASGCNLLGYYMFRGGTNPKGEKTPYLNEGQVPKLSYDYQAAIGEFGQIRPSYRRLKRIHLFAKTWEEKLCRMKTVLPEQARDIKPEDVDTLRFAVRYDGEGGFLFLNNYQDHMELKQKTGHAVRLKLPEEELVIRDITLAAGENAILPFLMKMGEIRLMYATAQLLTVLEDGDLPTYFFFAPKGMCPRYVFDAETVCRVEGQNFKKYSSKTLGEMLEICLANDGMDSFLAEGTSGTIRIVTLTDEQSQNFYVVDMDRRKQAVITPGALLYDGSCFRVESEREAETISFWPPVNWIRSADESDCTNKDIWLPAECLGIFQGYRCEKVRKNVSAAVRQIGPCRYTVTLPEHYMNGLKEALLTVEYEGDIAHLFLDGDLIADHFCNGKPWETGLKLLEPRLAGHKLTLCITPLKEESRVNVESAMAGRKEEVEKSKAALKEIRVKPVYEYAFDIGRMTGWEA